MAKEEHRPRSVPFGGVTPPSAAPSPPAGTAQGLKAQLAYREKLLQLINRIHAAKSLDTIFIELKQDMLDLVDAERMTFYAVDRERREIYSRFLDVDTVKEIRVPINPTSVAGYVAKTGDRVNIADAYNKDELARIDNTLSFDASWDRKTGFRTRQILAVPIMYENRLMMGVIQLLNKKRGDQFTSDDQANVVEIAKTMATALHTLQRLHRRRPGKFDYLRIQDLITEDELNQAITEARRQQTDVESILVSKYRIRKEDIGVALTMFYKCQFIEFTDKIIIPPELLANVKVDYLKKNYWVPVAQRGKTIEVLVDNPHDVQKVDNVKRLFAGYDVRFFVGLRQDIIQFIDYATNQDTGTGGSITSILGELAEEVAVEEEEEGGDREVDLNDSAVVRLANQVILDAYKAGASDIHIEPYLGKNDTVIRYRIDGGCIEYQKVPASFRRAIVARLKIMSSLDIAERRKPQDGKIKFKLQDNKEIELRVATIPTAGGNEDVVMRILAASEPIPLDKLGMTDRNFREFREIISKPYGLILCVGPTGSGKTTSLHSALGYINKPDRKIWTAEDPVEITQYGLRQVQVQPKIGFTFAAALRAFLRADPDVIMIGEMRDEETAHAGIEASLTGHLVLSTLHTNSASETVVRLLDMGLDPFNFADALLGILAQRLVKRLCATCKEAYHPEIDEFIGVVMGYGEREFEKLGIHYDENFVLYKGKGCANCNNSGYRGRAGIHELLVATDPVKKLVQTRARVSEIGEAAQAEGMTTLLQDGILKAIKGLTDYKQVKAVALK
jgi:type II secretory ATPase GspE/PulE/Tfp pilus assembly ATPase PilB-like protein/GAF domain-containing protein